MPKGDCISREALKKHKLTLQQANGVEIEKKRKQGEWAFDEKGYFYCACCGKYPHDQYATTDFCPNCGLPMKKGGKE